MSQATTAPSNFLDAYQVVKPSGAGVVQVCFAPQPIETTNAVRYQGLTAELDFHAEAMSGFGREFQSCRLHPDRYGDQ